MEDKVSTEREEAEKAKRRGDMAKFCKLPEEMVQFLSRLPPKDLMRFKCVHKSWYNLIHSPRFVAMNLSNSMNNKFCSSTCIIFKRTVLKDNTIVDKNEISVILRDGSNEKKECLLTVLNLCNDSCCDIHNHHHSIVDINLPLPMSVSTFALHIAGHCDGIICLKAISDEDIILCNPGIKEYRFLPKSCLLLPPKKEVYEDDYDGIDYYDEIEYSTTHAVGFGYDSKTKTYKVVRIVEFTGSFTVPSKRAEVYTMGAKSWREIQTNIQSHVYWTPSFVIYFKGISYWLAFTREDKEVILSFNMSDEVFHEITLPNCFHLSNGWRTSLAVLEGSIVLLTYEGVREIPYSFDIWMMDNTGGVKVSWTKYLTVVAREDIEIPLAFLKSDELLMVTMNGHVVSYNLSIQKFKELPIHGIEDPKYIQALIYVNSIVSIYGHDEL